MINYMTKIKINLKSIKFIIFFFILVVLIINTNIDAQQDNSEEKDNLKVINENLTTQPQDNREKNSNSLTSFFIRTVIVLLILIVIYLFIKFRFSRSSQSENTDKHFSILLKQQINRNTSLAVLEFFGSYYIISIGNDISILEKIENQETIDAIKIQAGKEMPKKTFFEYLGLSQNRLEKVVVMNKFNELKEKLNNIKKGDPK